MLSRSVLAHVTRGYNRPVNGRLLAQSRFSSAPVLGMLRAKDSGNKPPLPKPELPVWKRELRFWLWFVPAVVVYEWCWDWYEESRGMKASKPAEVTDSQIINMLLALQADAGDAIPRTIKKAASFPAPNPGDPGSVSHYLLQIMFQLCFGLSPTRELGAVPLRELVPLLSSGSSWKPIKEAVENARDSTATELLRQAEAEILAIRISACREIYNLLHSEEANAGQKAPIDDIKDMVRPLLDARINMSSKVFRPVVARLKEIEVQWEQPEMLPREVKEKKQEYCTVG